MDLRDIFVAFVAITLGGTMLYASIINEGWCFQMRIAQAIEDNRGRKQARTVIASAGTVIIFLGLYLLLSPMLIVSLFQQESRENNFQTVTGSAVFAEAE